MAKVKIQGNASGTGVITLVAPNTNTDRTVTLPDESITLAGGVAGIVSSADATAITIDSSENVGIGVASPDAKAHFYSVTGGKTVVIENPNNDYAGIEFKANGLLEGRIKVANDGMHFYSDTGATSKIMRFTEDGRGLSQFTAKAWARINQTGTQSITDSHNVSSITDEGTGDTQVNFSNSMANANYTFNVTNTKAAGYATIVGDQNMSTTTSNLSFRLGYVSGTNGEVTAVDNDYVMLQVFGD